jgi:hypothetical protein
VADDELHIPTEYDRLARVLADVRALFARLAGPPRDYRLTRWLILRLVGVVYLFAFLGLVQQGLPLLGHHGLTPIDALGGLPKVSFWQAPTLFVFDSSDAAIRTWTWIGLVLSVAVVVGYANTFTLIALWLIYGSFVLVGQRWWEFGWEIQLLETGILAAVLAHPWDPRPLAARGPPVTAIVLFRWLTFRIMIGAGLIKLRGSACWTDLTCLDAHFETQPIPNPLSPLFHHMPHAVLAGGVVFNHIVELVLPCFAFGPRRLRIVAGCGMAAFQLVLIVSGNLAFLNWLTLIPILACFDDDALLRVLPRRVRTWLRVRLPERESRDRRQLWIALVIALGVCVFWQPFTSWMRADQQVALGFAITASVVGFLAVATPVRESVVAWLTRGKRLDGNQLAIGAFAALVVFKSWAVVDNLFVAKHQIMNTQFDRIALVNTYGAFGSVGQVRHELVIEGTMDPDPQHATWREYELPCKPGALDRRPCVLGPYHRRLDWLIWFAAMIPPEETPWGPPPADGEDDQRRQIDEIWIIHVAWKLLDGDRSIRELLAVDPFDGAPPKWIRIRRFVYHLEPWGAETWWTRDHPKLWLPPVSVDTPWFIEALHDNGWPSPSLR